MHTTLFLLISCFLDITNATSTGRIFMGAPALPNTCENMVFNSPASGNTHWDNEMQWEEIEDLMASSDEDPVESEGDFKQMRKVEES